MQKIEKKASIMVWTIFLSLVIAMAFLGISTKIHSNIKNSGNFVHTLDTQTMIKNELASGAVSYQYEDIKIPLSITLDFEDTRDMIRTLRSSENSQFQFHESGSSDIILSLLSGGPIQYKYETGGSITQQGVTTQSSSFQITGSGSLFMKNLGGNTRFRLQSSQADIIAPEMHYDVYRKVGNLNNTQSNGTILHFVAGDFD